MRLLGTLHFNVSLNSGYLIELIIKAFSWSFGHSYGVLFPVVGG